MSFRDTVLFSISLRRPLYIAAVSDFSFLFGLRFPPCYSCVPLIRRPVYPVTYRLIDSEMSAPNSTPASSSPSVADATIRKPIWEASAMEQKPVNPHRSAAGYMVAFVVLGTAVANLFLKNRAKKVMNFKIPKFDADTAYRRQAEDAAAAQAKRAAREARKFAGSYNEKSSSSRAGSTPSSSWYQQDEHLATLGLGRYQCTEEDIKKAFLKLAKEHHPDILPADLSQVERDAHIQKFQKINQAHRELLEHVRLLNRVNEGV